MMTDGRTLCVGVLALAALAAAGAPARSLASVQVGASGKTYASADVQCALNPITGMAPMVQAGLYNPKKSASATVSLNGAPVATVTFSNPDAILWLASGINTAVVALNRKTADAYAFDASLSYPGQPNVCIPDVSGNSIDVINDLETAASGDSSATVTPGCAWNPLSGRAQPYVNLFDDGAYLLDVSINDVPLTQLNGTTRTHAAVFLSAGLNVISAANGSVSTDYFVRDGGDGSCMPP